MEHTNAIAVEDINQVFRLRRSGRGFDPASAVSSHDLAALFEAARWAPSGGNLQPWRYVYTQKTDGEAYEHLLQLLNDGNREWAQHAPVLILSGVSSYRTNAHGETIPNMTALHDVGMANLSIALEAVHRSLMTHIMGGFDKEGAREFLPEGVDPVVMMAVGYAGDVSTLSDHNQGRENAPRTRRPIEEFVRRV